MITSGLSLYVRAAASQGACAQNGTHELNLRRAQGEPGVVI